MIKRVYIAASWKRNDLSAIHQKLADVGIVTVDPREYHKPDDTDSYIAFQDLVNIRSADALVLVLPSGNSSHIEAGLARGLGMPVFVTWSYPPSGVDNVGEPYLTVEQEIDKLIASDPMYLWFDNIMPIDCLAEWLEEGVLDAYGEHEAQMV